VERISSSPPGPARYRPDDVASSQTRRRSLPQTPRTDAELLARDRRLSELEVLAAERLDSIRKLEQVTAEQAGEVELLSTDRNRLITRVEELTGEVDRLTSELEHMKNVPVQAGWTPSRRSSPLFRNPSPQSMEHSTPLSRRCSPARSAVITELKQLLENNQLTAKRLKDELNQISRKSSDEDAAVVGLQSVYRELSNCCTELEISLHQSSADFDRLFTPELVGVIFLCAISSDHVRVRVKVRVRFGFRDPGSSRHWKIENPNR